MLLPYVLLRHAARASSAARSTEGSFDAALSWLVNTASSNSASGRELRVFEKERPWATASTIIVHGETEMLDRRANCMIRWLEKPERNVNIELNSRDNMYTVQVKAVYYAILNAMFHRESHAIIFSPNDIVVKVGNGIYKAKKEVEMFTAIKRRTATNDSAKGTSVKLRLLNNEALKKTQKILKHEGPPPKVIPSCYSENAFRKVHSNEIAIV
ncbi:hypothetical protein Q1695_010940 [Nippostrongylus brasiliensis]|nr:hypothetical protein Q1695_010940 [Nippostrongylus brasiliensis]